MGAAVSLATEHRISLTQGYETVVDAEDYERFGRLAWYAGRSGGGKIYAVRRPRNPRCHFQLHRLIMGVQDPETGEQLSDLVVDHINGNTLDNRRRNLRLVTQQENAWNRQEEADCITFNKQLGKWQAAVFITAKSREEAVEVARRMKEAGRGSCN